MLINIPEEITTILESNPLISRMELKDKCGISEHAARIYVWLWKYGVGIHAKNVALPESGTKKALVLPDVHAPYHDQRALDCALNYGVEYDPDVVIMHGDGVDCYAISFFKNDPTKPHFAREVELARDTIEEITECFPNAEKIYIEGNHELRLRSELWGNSKKLAGLDILTIPNLYGLNDMGWDYVSNSELLQNDLKPFSLGKLYILHGTEIRVSYSVVNIPRIYYYRAHVNMLVAHHHATQEYIQRKLDNTHEGAWSVGCLCKLSPEYSPSNNWNHGFATVDVYSDGNFSVDNKKIIDGVVR